MGEWRLGLLGSGEFEPWTEPVDRWLLDHPVRGDGRVAIVPTASAPEGDGVFADWGAMARQHYGRLGIETVDVPLKTRDDANRPEVATPLEQVSMVFFSGGNPAYLAHTLAGTLFWKTLLAAMSEGLAYAGCSAGIACFGEAAPDSTARALTTELWQPGLGLFPNVYLGPHWDALDGYVPGLREFFIASVPKAGTLLAVDERTAVVGDGSRWRVLGSGSAHLLEDGTWRRFPSGDSFVAPLIAKAS